MKEKEEEKDKQSMCRPMVPPPGTMGKNSQTNGNLNFTSRQCVLLGPSTWDLSPMYLILTCDSFTSIGSRSERITEGSVQVT